MVTPIAVPATQGAWYRGWRLVSMDGSTLDIADEKEKRSFGRPGTSRRQRLSADPFVSLIENAHSCLQPMADYATNGSTCPVYAKACCV